MGDLNCNMFNYVRGDQHIHNNTNPLDCECILSA
jgi:hypothetical protein